MRVFLLFLGVWLSTGLAWGQARYWVFLTDKAPEATPALSPAALAHRARQGIVPDQRDLPVRADYVAAIAATGAGMHHTSRWFNAVTATLTPAQRAAVADLPFVQKVQPVRHLSRPAEVEAECPEEPFYGEHLRQLHMLGINALHQQGYTGAGVTVAVFDNGYHRVDSLPAFAHLFEEGKILATRDYVDGDDDVFSPCIHCRHGTYVFSILAARAPGRLIGAAPDAQFILLRTEDDYGESRQEEDNWVAAAEFADSLGAQIFTTSLGYFDFDDSEEDYRTTDLDGNTTIITRAADLAASRGILVVNSAGNNGWRGINAPADGDSVLAIGAVNECREYSAFSSRGPTADGRLKPDLAAMGEYAFFLHPDGEMRRGNGTSFSCPLVSGLAACLQQAVPGAGNMDLYEALLQSGDQHDAPDNYLGHGLPQAGKALAWLLSDTLPAFAYTEPFATSAILVYPNPNKGQFALALEPGFVLSRAQIELFDASGRQVMTRSATLSPTDWRVQVAEAVVPGLYLLRVRDLDQPSVRFLQKVSIQP
ncbi:MAG: T9SS C-terminal target domain-containing protein [Bacteroidetes bacterium]|nr:MAG: T9SS C-terminal target domain-containing protein [Bacteroidota bacterium]